jgi:hypothetical protein
VHPADLLAKIQNITDFPSQVFAPELLPELSTQSHESN